MRRRFTPEEDELIRYHYPIEGMAWDGWAVLVPNHSTSSIASRANRLGLVGPHPKHAWTEEEDRVLLTHAIEIKRETGRSVFAIVGRLSVLAARAECRNRRREQDRERHG